MLKLVLCGMRMCQISPETTVCRRLQTDDDQPKIDETTGGLLEGKRLNIQCREEELYKAKIGRPSDTSSFLGLNVSLHLELCAMVAASGPR
jgi:hypothetical protein